MKTAATAALPVPGAVEPLAAPTADPAGTSRTRRRVAMSILAHGPSTVAQLAERLDLTPAAIRRHLDLLVAEALVEAREQRSYGPRGRGRPARLFALTADGRDTFHHGDGELAVDALEFLRETAGSGAVEIFASRRFAALGERLRPQVVGADAPQRIEALATALSAAGFPTTTTTTGAGTVQLCQHACPVAHVAAGFPEFCAAETELIAGLLGTHVQRLATIAHGDGVCTTHVPAGVPARAHRPVPPGHSPPAPGAALQETAAQQPPRGAHASRQLRADRSQHDQSQHDQSQHDQSQHDQSQQDQSQQERTA